MEDNPLIEGATFLVAIQTVAVCCLNIFNTKLANRYLGGLILVFLFSTKYFLFNYLESVAVRYFLDTLSTAQFYGPVFYLFLLAIIGKASYRLQLEHLALPVGILLLSFLSSYGGLFGGSLYIRLIVGLEYGMILYYGFRCWLLFREGHLKHVKVWRRYWLFFVIVYAYLIYNFTDFLIMIFWEQAWYGLRVWLFYPDMLLYLLCFCFLILFGLTELNWVRKLVVPASIHLQTGQQPERLEQFGQKLRHLFEKEAVHLDPELNLKSLAEKLEMPTAMLSDYLKAENNTTFYELVNQYRVAEFKSKLKDFLKN